MHDLLIKIEYNMHGERIKIVMSCFSSSTPFIISPVLFLILCTFKVLNRIVLLRSLFRRRLHLSRVFPMGFLASFFSDEQGAGLLH